MKHLVLIVAFTLAIPAIADAQSRRTPRPGGARPTDQDGAKAIGHTLGTSGRVSPASLAIVPLQARGRVARCSPGMAWRTTCAVPNILRCLCPPHGRPLPPHPIRTAPVMAKRATKDHIAMHCSSTRRTSSAHAAITGSCWWSRWELKSK